MNTPTLAPPDEIELNMLFETDKPPFLHSDFHVEFMGFHRGQNCTLDKVFFTFCEYLGDNEKSSF